MQHQSLFYFIGGGIFFILQAFKKNYIPVTGTMSTPQDTPAGSTKRRLDEYSPLVSTECSPLASTDTCAEDHGSDDGENYVPEPGDITSFDSDDEDTIGSGDEEEETFAGYDEGDSINIGDIVAGRDGSIDSLNKFESRNADGEDADTAGDEGEDVLEEQDDGDDGGGGGGDDDDDGGGGGGGGAATNDGTGEGSTRSKKKKQKKEVYYKLAHMKQNSTGTPLVFLAFDIETTGPARQFDRIIEISMVAYDEYGVFIDEFSTRIGSDVKIESNSRAVHGISDKDIAGMPKFDAVGPQMLGWCGGVIGNGTGVLVAHNGDSFDFRFLFCEMLRHKLTLPPSIKYTCDTYAKLGRRWNEKFSSIDYFKASEGSWPNRQDANPDRPSMSVSNIVNYLLNRRSRIELSGGPFAALHNADANHLTFESVCGPAHEAAADARAAAIVHMDKEGIRKAGESNNSKGIYRKIDDVLAEAKVAWATQPLFHHEVAQPYVELTPESPMPTSVPVSHRVVHPEFRPEAKPGPTEYFKEEIGIANMSEEDIASVPIKELMVKVFLYYFSFTIIQHIVDCTNKYAQRPKVVVVDPQTGKKKKRPPQTAEERDKARPHCVKWKPLTVGEFVVFCGMCIVMGVLNRKRTGHYWLPVDGFYCELIATAMKKERYFEILANLSFINPYDETSHRGDKLRKIRFVVNYLGDRAKKAFTLLQKFAIDETMIATNSRYCPYKQLMKCKPIKNGIKVFDLCESDSNYLYAFEIYTGSKGWSISVEGTPFVQDLICNKLIDSSFDNTGRIAFMDAFFSTAKVFSALLKRGVYAVGPTRAKQPKKKSSRNWSTWPTQDYKRSHSRYVGGKVRIRSFAVFHQLYSFCFASQILHARVS